MICGGLCNCAAAIALEGSFIKLRNEQAGAMEVGDSTRNGKLGRAPAGAGHDLYSSIQMPWWYTPEVHSLGTHRRRSHIKTNRLGLTRLPNLISSPVHQLPICPKSRRLCEHVFGTSIARRRWLRSQAAGLSSSGHGRQHPPSRARRSGNAIGRGIRHSRSGPARGAACDRPRGTDEARSAGPRCRR